MSLLDALPHDVLVHVLSMVPDASSLRALFACSRSHVALRLSNHLRKTWLQERTNAQAEMLLNRAVDLDDPNQVRMLLESDFRCPYTTTQLSCALLLAMKLRHTVMCQLIPYCLVSLSLSDEMEMARIVREADVAHGFQRCMVKVHGQEDSTHVIEFTTINAFTTSDENQAVFTYFECRSAHQHRKVKNGITLILGAPADPLRQAMVQKLIILNRKLVIKCRMQTE